MKASPVDTLMSLAPALPPAVDYLVTVQIAEGRLEEAMETFAGGGGGPDEKGAFLLMRSGRKKEAREMAGDVIERARRFIARGDEGPTPLERGAFAFAVIGERDSAVAWLERAFRAGWNEYRLAERNPLLESIREAPGFVRLNAAARERTAGMRARIATSPGDRSP